jgi:cGMP-dependent protein kinase 1
MGREGYLKLVDLGSAKKLVPPAMTNTICGTPEYVAPEMIAARGHGRAVDFWSLGVFLFELLHRATPFEQNDTVSFSFQSSVVDSSPRLVSTKRSSTLMRH